MSPLTLVRESRKKTGTCAHEGVCAEDEEAELEVAAAAAAEEEEGAGT